MMFENGYVQQKIRPAYNRARIECRGRKPFIHESRFEAVSHPMDFVRSDYLKGIDDQVRGIAIHQIPARSEEHTSELQSLMRISYAVFCLKKKIKTTSITNELFNYTTQSTYQTRAEAFTTIPVTITKIATHKTQHNTHTFKHHHR